jgi:hypothetical protein
LPDVQPLVDSLKQAFSPLQQIFDSFQPAIESIQQLSAALQLLPDKFNSIFDNGNRLVAGLQAVVAKWGTTLVVVLVILGLLAIIYFGVPFVDNVSRGWRMLRGQPTD